MLAAAGNLEFERAATLRDRLQKVKAMPESEGLVHLASDPRDERGGPSRAGMPGTRGKRKGKPRPPRPGTP
jgi:excinuclease UvrABC nuclease subunit